MGLKAPSLQTLRRLPDGFIDACQRLITRQAVIGKHEVQIDRQARYVTDEQIDRGAALEGKGVVHKNEWGDLG